MAETKNIMIVGVGGQGTLLTSRILGGITVAAGYDVKLSEVHGMAQRGGSVVTFVRYGEKVAENTPVLFGGSVNPSNAGAYLTVPGVNGLLIGGSSLILSEFVDIIETAKRVR